MHIDQLVAPKPQPISWPAKVQVNTTTAVSLLAARKSQRCIARASNGRIWVPYVGTSLENLYIAYSDDNGGTWTEELVLTDAVSTTGFDVDSCFILLIDSNDVPILIWKRSITITDQDIRYVDRTGGSWGSAETIYNPALGGEITAVVAVIDSSDNIHIAFDNTQTDDADYIIGTSGSWSSPETIEEDEDIGDIAVNSSGEPVASIKIHLRVRTAGVWQAIDTFDDQSSDPDWGAKLAIDSKGDYHVVWTDNTGALNVIYYRKKTSGVWGTTIIVITGGADDWSDPILVLDDNDDAYIIYQYDAQTTESENVWYKKIASGVLGDEVTLDDDISQPGIYQSCYTGLYHRYPSTGILPASVCPVVVLLDETGIQANLYFESD